MARAPISHSLLANGILHLASERDFSARKKFADELIRESSSGVVEEGGIIVVGDKATIQSTGSGFKFGKASEAELIGVDNRLVQVARLALSLSSQDFGVFDGLRTVAEQRKLVNRGMSKTMNSKHLEGLALDLVPWYNGKYVWEWSLIYPVVMAVDRAATQLGYAHLITWGGAWDRTLADFGSDKDSQEYKREVSRYCERHAGKDFIDGPHFQIRGPKQ